jgi:hypothetical protein
MMKEKPNVFVGNKSHWRLQKLYDLQLTYPDHDKDLEQIKEWHVQKNADNAKNSLLFEEALDAMREQQQLFLEATKDASSSLQLVNTIPLDSSTDLDVKGSFYGIALKEANKMEQYYKSINKNLNGLASQKEKLFTEPFIVQSKQGVCSKQEERVDVELPYKHSLSDHGIDFGKCYSCATGRKTHMFVPCGHLSVCGSCAERMLRDPSCCPICDSNARDVVRVKVT